uniref:Mitochondrial import inner membrane translocase subunit TIM50 n=1 Tax=Noctiluca scintillans TaxID=2966 RepID=A0A7S1A748_NOCSC
MAAPLRGVTKWPFGARRSQASRPLVVALDMDECLIHSKSFSSSSDSFRQEEASRAAGTTSNGVSSFRLTFADSVSCTVLMRPGLDEFLKECCSRWTTYVITAGTQEYAEPLLDKLDPAGNIAGRFYRHDCRRVRTSYGEQFLKDLSTILTHHGRDEDDLSRIVLVDNNPVSFVCQPDNGIPVPDFVGKADDMLARVLKVLARVDAEDDVRPVLKGMFGVDKVTSELRRQLCIPDDFRQGFASERLRPSKL